jgi:hypothetical protein
MEKEQRQVHELEAPLLPGDGDGDAAGKAAAAAGSAYALVCSLVASAISIIYGYSKQTSLQPHACACKLAMRVSFQVLRPIIILICSRRQIPYASINRVSG